MQETSVWLREIPCNDSDGEEQTQSTCADGHPRTAQQKADGQLGYYLGYLSKKAPAVGALRTTTN